MMTNDQEEKDFFHCIHGYSAYTKGLYKKALLSFNSISRSQNYKQIKNYLLGNVHFSLKGYDKSVEHYKDWIKEIQGSNKVITSAVYRNLGLSYLHLKEYVKAKDYFEKEFSLISNSDTLAIIKAKMSLANVYYNQYLDDDAIPLFKEAYDLAKVYSDVELKQNSSLNMAVVERNRKKYKESVEYYREFIRWKDSLFNKDKIWELTEKDKQFAVAQKENEIAIQDEKLKTQKVVQRALIFGASGLLIFLALLGFFYKKLQKQNSLITQQKEDLAIANKTKNYLFSVVSHDLRSPMNTIKHQHLQLKKHIADNNLEGIKEANNSAITVTESTSHLLNNVLHWSLEQNNQMVFEKKEYPFKPIVEHVLYDYENLIEANDVKIKTNYIKNSLIKADRESLKIVLRNLLDNSVKYMNGKGEISIEMGVDSENYAYVSIQDTGIGITAERLAKINRLKDVSIDKINRSEGVGLGLILCQTLVKKNDGIITFDSEEGKGTKVTIQLPIFN
ncbi:tetratricopeptide repeat-containing sensor histidine kinase [Tenacibaculum sp. SZ-18]|uniref:tetratricopeptide repeat-containing sensor histidine kinase n=1 Tax=Tenacibaculum sp. SZ-18 TaxID=754423 RepID=UPI0012FE132B|nr:tetratricopeptide repeat-containing sensor histidine kinase [Tenacibaculum sp. SZ-18]